MPIFRDENGQRRLHLVVDMGTTFLPSDITVQVSDVACRLVLGQNYSGSRLDCAAVLLTGMVRVQNFVCNFGLSLVRL